MGISFPLYRCSNDKFKCLLKISAAYKTGKGGLIPSRPCKSQGLSIYTQDHPLLISSRDLAPGFIGPFSVSSVINPRSGRLELTMSLRIHSTFWWARSSQWGRIGLNLLNFHFLIIYSSYCKTFVLWEAQKSHTLCYTNLSCNSVFVVLDTKLLHYCYASKSSTVNLHFRSE